MRPTTKVRTARSGQIFAAAKALPTRLAPIPEGPHGRPHTLCALSDGCTTVDRGTTWKAAQITDSVGPITYQVRHNSFDALGDNNDNGMAAQVGSWAHIVKSGGTSQRDRKFNRPSAAAIGKHNPITITCEKDLEKALKRHPDMLAAFSGAQYPTKRSAQNNEES